MTPREVIENTEWSALYHGYERATDTPLRLLGLLTEDPEICGDALVFLHQAVLSRGEVFPVTAPVAAFVAGILGDARVGVVCQNVLPWERRPRPLRAGLLDWLGSMADAATFREDLDDELKVLIEEEAEEDEDEEDDWEANSLASLQACRGLLPEIYEVVLPFVDDADEEVREAAEAAVDAMLGAPELAGFRDEQVQRRLREAVTASPRERAVIALIIGGWDMVPGDLLTDPDPAVRASAAIAPALDEDPAALAEVRAALRDPRTADSWFPEPVASLPARFRYSLVAALLRRTSAFSEVLDEALIVARMGDNHTGVWDWGPMLERAFPVRHTDGRPLSAHQRAFLQAIVDNDANWGNGTPVIFFLQAGLPTERDELRDLLRA